MPLPVPAPEPITVYDRQGADDFAALGRAVAAHQAQQHPVTLVYAPTSITHHHASPTPLTVSAARAGAPGHPGIDVNVTGYGSGFLPPADVSGLPPVPEHRTFAPLAFLVCGWSTLAAALGTAVTGGDAAALAATLAALTGTAASAAAMYRRQQ